MATVAASENPKHGLAIYAADLGHATSNQTPCQVNLDKLTLIGNPLAETDIEYFDQKTGEFKLNISQFDWLSANKEVIAKARPNGSGYYAMALTLDGMPVYAGVALSQFSSLVCINGQPVFWENMTYQAKNPGPNPRDAQSYLLSIFILSHNNRTIPKLDAKILDRLKETGKLKK